MAAASSSTSASGAPRGAAVHVDPVTARWGEALFRLALRRGELQAVHADVTRVAREVESPRVAAYLFDARVPLEQRRAALRPVLARCGATFRAFAELLFDKRREAVLRGLHAAWHQRSLVERGAVEGLVESARPLGPGEIAELAAALGRRLGLEVLLDTAVRPELLAGARVTVGGRQLDGTAAERLEGIRRRMLAAPVGASARG